MASMSNLMYGPVWKQEEEKMNAIQRKLDEEKKREEDEQKKRDDWAEEYLKQQPLKTPEQKEEEERKRREEFIVRDTLDAYWWVEKRLDRKLTEKERVLLHCCVKQNWKRCDKNQRKNFSMLGRDSELIKVVRQLNNQGLFM